MAKKTARDDELSKKEKIREKFVKICQDVEKGIQDQQGRSDSNQDHWDAYDCILGTKQFYNGNSNVFISLIADAVDARQTRFTNQLFPQSQRYVEVTTEDADIPHATMALLEHYVRRTKLRTEIVPPLFVCGDIEGQYTVYVDWKSTERHIVHKVKKPVVVDGIEHPDMDPVDDIEEETITEGCPDVEVILDTDLVVLPAVATSLEDAIDQGGTVTIIRRWRKAKMKQMVKDGHLVKDIAEDLMEAMDVQAKAMVADASSSMAGSAGIKSKGDYSLIYEIWFKMEVDGDMRLCRGYSGGKDRILSVKLCPYWCDKVPVISVPVNKKAKVTKGIAPIKKVLDLQYLANDYLNEGADTGHFSAMPIIFTDPEKNPRVSSMVLGLGAIWETSPRDTEFAKFPEMWKDALERVGALKDQIFQSLGVNPSMIPNSSGKPGAKRNQAEIAMEQQVDILTTADAVTRIEEGILTPLLQRFAEYDHQFRDEPLMIRMFGEMGQKAIMQDVEPIAMNRRLEFRWYGVEAARNAAQLQQQMGLLNILKEIPPQMYQGYRIDMGPMIAQAVENQFGPRLAPLTFISMKDDLGVDPQLENEMMEFGHDVPIHPGDNDAQHLQVHQQAMMAGDPHGVVRVHMQKHMMQMQAKTAMQQMQQMQQPGGPPQQGGGGPQPGASPGQPHAVKGPPGQIHKDQMAGAGAVTMPRKT